MVTFQYCAEDKWYNIHLNILYKYETNVEDIFAENDVLQHELPLYTSVIYIKYWNKVYNHILMGTLEYIHIISVGGVL